MRYRHGLLASVLLLSLSGCPSVPEFRGDDGGGPANCENLNWKEVGPEQWSCYAEALEQAKDTATPGALSVRGIDYTYSGGSSCEGGFGLWSGGVVAENGKIYMLPHCTREVLVLDPGGDPEVSFIGGTEITAAEPSFNGTDNRWRGGVLAHDGKIYALPRSSKMLLTIDPATDQVAVTDVASIDEVDAYGSVLAPDGTVWAIPEEGQLVAFFDPSDGSAGVAAIDGKAAEGGWRGGVLAPDGLIYGMPGPGYDRILVIDPVRRSATLGPQTPETSWSSGVPLASGEIVFVPNEATNVLRLGPNGEITTVAAPPTQGDTDKWKGAAYLADGRVLGGIDDDGRILEVSDAGASAVLELGVLSGSGLVHGLNGKVYSVPYYSDVIHEISGGDGRLPDDVVLSAFFNKF